MQIVEQAPGTRSRALGLLVGFGAFASLYGISDTPQVAVAFAPVVPAAVRMAMVRVWVDGDRLRVRNFWRSYTLERTGISGFGVEDTLGGRGGRNRTVYAQLVDGGTRRLAATRRFYRAFLAFLPTEGKHNGADEICNELNAWLAAAT